MNKELLEEFIWDFVNSYDTVNDSENILQAGIDLLIKRIENC